MSTDKDKAESMTEGKFQTTLIRVEDKTIAWMHYCVCVCVPLLPKHVASGRAHHFILLNAIWKKAISNPVCVFHIGPYPRLLQIPLNIERAKKQYRYYIEHSQRFFR
jgi:hypothetical protein